MGLTYRGDLVATSAEVTAASGVVEVRSDVSVRASSELQARIGIALQAGLAVSYCSPWKVSQGMIISLWTSHAYAHETAAPSQGESEWVPKMCAISMPEESALESMQSQSCWYPGAIVDSHYACISQALQTIQACAYAHRRLIREHHLLQRHYLWTSAAGWKGCV